MQAAKIDRFIGFYPGIPFEVMTARSFTVRTVMIILLLLFVPLFVFSQSPIKVQQDTFSRPMPLIGFNTNAHHSLANWKVPAFRDSTASLFPAILRYPGGTTANYWDWKTGWFQNAATTPPEYLNINPKNTIRAEEFKLGTDAAKAEALFVLNIQHSSLEYELKGIQHAESLGFSLRYIELGNEHNLKISDQYIAPEVYADSVAKWSDTLKRIFPQSKICLVGGAPPATPGWHDSIFARSPKIDAMAFHVYLGAGNSDSLLNAKRALSVPFAQLNQRFVLGKFSTLPQHLEVWVTEFNMGEALAGNPQQHAETWTHALYVAAMIHLFLENPKITMIIDHNLTNHMEFAAISPYDLHITANGSIMRLFGETSKGMQTASRLIFPTVSPQVFGTTVFPKLLGWKFVKGKEERGIIVNLSSDTINCSLTDLFTLPSFALQTWGDPLMQVSGTGKLQHSISSNLAMIPVLPYSVTQIHSQPITAVRKDASAPQTFTLLQNYPNPFNPSTTIEYSLNTSGFTTLKVFDALGRTMSILVNSFQLEGAYSIPFTAVPSSSGMYFYRLESNGRAVTKKMMVLQ